MAPTRIVHLQLDSSRCTRLESRVASHCLQLTYLDPPRLWRLVISLMAWSYHTGPAIIIHDPISQTSIRQTSRAINSTLWNIPPAL